MLTDRLGSRRALLLFGALTVAGFALYWAAPSIPMIFLALPLVMAWQSLGLPATFSLLKEELSGGGRLVGFTVQSVVKRLPIVLAPPVGGYPDRSLRHGERDACRVFPFHSALAADARRPLARFPRAPRRRRTQRRPAPGASGCASSRRWCGC